MSLIAFKSLHQSFGKEVLGVNLQSKLKFDVLSKLTQALMDNKVLLFRDQNLNSEQLAEFGRAWSGRTRIDSFTEMHVPGYDDINVIGNVGELFADADYRNGAAFWHTDCAAENDPDATTMLYCIHALPENGETVLADMELAYFDLDDDIKNQIDELTARHCYAGARPILGGKQSWEHELTPVTEETERNFPAPVNRPIARTHSITGRKGLYAPAGSIFEVPGMPDREANELMFSLKVHATQDKYCYAHQYKPGDVLVWDNTSTMHYGKPVAAATGDHDRRLMHRISPLGIPVGVKSMNV